MSQDDLNDRAGVSFSCKKDIISHRKHNDRSRHDDGIIHRSGLHWRRDGPEAEEEDYQSESDGEDVDEDSEDAGEVEGSPIEVSVVGITGDAGAGG